MIDLSSPSGAVRLDPAGFDALIEAARHPQAGTPADVRQALADGRLDAIMPVVLDPAAQLRLLVAGPTSRLEHRGWLTDQALVLLLGVRPGLLQLTATDPAFLTATLVRLTRMRPRHLPQRLPATFTAARLDQLVTDEPSIRAKALADAHADFAWRLDLASDSDRRSLIAVDGELGLRFAHPDEERMVPVTNTFCYRVLSTIPGLT
jgi:hypothetical protein